MAIAKGVASFQMRDDDGEVISKDIPFQYNDATATLANIVTWVQGLGVKLDLVTDDAMTKIRISLLIPLPGGIKSAPVANSDNEKTGLFTLAATGTPNAYGDDVPAFPASKFSGNQINPADTDVVAYLAYLSTPVTTIVGTDRYGNVLTGVARTAVKTFRKHRRALRRA